MSCVNSSQYAQSNQTIVLTGQKSNLNFIPRSETDIINTEIHWRNITGTPFMCFSESLNHRVKLLFSEQNWIKWFFTLKLSGVKLKKTNESWIKLIQSKIFLITQNDNFICTMLEEIRLSGYKGWILEIKIVKKENKSFYWASAPTCERWCSDSRISHDSSRLGRRLYCGTAVLI